MRISYTAEARDNGSGPTAGDLQKFLAAIPPEAGTRIATEAPDRPGTASSWRIEATWDQEQQDAWIQSQRPEPDWTDLQRHGPEQGTQGGLR